MPFYFCRVSPTGLWDAVKIRKKYPLMHQQGIGWYCRCRYTVLIPVAVGRKWDGLGGDDVLGSVPRWLDTYVLLEPRTIKKM